ncbi:ATP-binding cassette domain-containing protein [Kitasatospora sp. NPDC036755]|uniref:ATP-binding cassette domain-containing protein n=1 Tax=Kitasatospora sp. NPDC036755 TaxID=3154600 RepID=UPI0033D73AB1
MIHTRGLTRSFRAKGETVEAVRGLDLDIEAGSVVAFLGPNGAGKTTSLRMLTTLLPPTAGTATVAGHDVVTDPAGVRRRIGYLGQGNSAGTGFRVMDELVTQGRAYGLGRTEAHARAERLLDALELEGLSRRTVGTLSGGQRRRLDIAMALVHEPDLLFLDEPSTGLDPHSRANIWEHVLRLHKDLGTTIVFTTHYLEEADLWAGRVLVIDHGRVIADDSPERLKAELAGDLITFTTSDPADTGPAATRARTLRAVREVTVEDREVRVRTSDGDVRLPELLRDLDAAGIRVHSTRLTRPTLDDVFLTLTGRTLRESADAGIPTTPHQGA